MDVVPPLLPWVPRAGSAPVLDLRQRQGAGVLLPSSWTSGSSSSPWLTTLGQAAENQTVGAVAAAVAHLWHAVSSGPFLAARDPRPAEVSRGATFSFPSRYDTPASSKKKVRLKDRNKLSTEERRKLFEQEVAQREAQKQQQQLQNLGMTSPLPYDSMGYGTPHHSFIGYPPGYPMQAYVDPSNPNAGKVLLPTPTMDSMCSPAAYEHPQPLVGHSVEATMPAPQPVPVVQHVATPLEVTPPQYVAQSDSVVHQEANVAVLPVPAAGAVQGQGYGVWDSSQQTVAVQQQYSPAQSQPAIYYQGQTCQTVYGVTSPYSQTTPPIVQVIPPPGGKRDLLRGSVARNGPRKERCQPARGNTSCGHPSLVSAWGHPALPLVFGCVVEIKSRPRG